MVTQNSIDKIELKKATTEYLRKQLGTIGTQVARISEIITHMRIFGRQSDEPDVKLDPRKVMTDAMNLVGEQLKLDSIKVTAGCDFECPVILGHAIRLEQVFLNIISNARDAILKSGRGAGRKITITGTPVDGDQLEISFTDTGGGISDHDLEHIFEPFYTTKKVGEGTGLGLSVSYGIIHDMGGTITAENVAGGARFAITLPTLDKSPKQDV